MLKICNKGGGISPSQSKWIPALALKQGPRDPISLPPNPNPNPNPIIPVDAAL